MKHKKHQAAARYRAAALLLVMGCLLPFVVPHGSMEVPGEIRELLKWTLRGEGDPNRRSFVYVACALTDKVGYFWGGKSRSLGWNRAWGWPRRVTAPGSDATGHIRRYGLDCSGLVSWAAATAWDNPEAYDRIGEGVRAQYALCVPTEEPRPGDLAFFPDLSHVGIVLGRDRDGVLWVVHCSASRGGVVVTPASVGFQCYGIPVALAKGEKLERDGPNVKAGKM